MLARAAAYSHRVYITPAPFQAALPYIHSRSYAKNNKPKKPFDYKAPIPTGVRNGPNAERTPAALAGRALRQDGSADRDIPNLGSTVSKLQQDYDTIVRSRSNKQPSLAEKGFSSLPPNVNQESSHPDLSNTRDEFQAFAPSDTSTTSRTISSFAIDPAEAQRGKVKQEPSRPLPDLTQGIPSTIDSEMASSSTRSDPASLNITEDPSQTGGAGGGDLPKTAYISSFERRRNRLANYFYASTLFAAIMGTVYLGRNWETEEEELKHSETPSGWGFGLFYNRARARLAEQLDYYNEPAFPKLLPNTDPMWERPYTLVLSLEDMLVHSEWSREHGWRMAKRPGVDYFLRYLSQYYELVIFTSVPSMIGHPILQKLDPYKIVMWPLFREATRYKKGEYIKDLSFLNRDLNKIVMLDTVPAHAKLQPDNAIILSKWKGDLKDKELVSFIPFLEYVATMGFEDTRAVIKSFEGKHIPTEFAHRESIARERFQQQLAEERAKRPKRSIGWLGNALGMKPHGGGIDGSEQSLSEGFEQGKTFQDQVRERGQKQYEILEKEIRENGEKWLKEMAEEEKKLNEEAMKGMKSSITNVFPFGGPSGKPSS